MVECNPKLDTVFASLADATRRDMVRRLSRKAYSIGELGKPYRMSFAGVAKHVEVLRRARLVQKRREGKHYIISLDPKMLRAASRQLDTYAQIWEARFDALEKLFAQ